MGAIYHLSIKVFSRGKGRSAVAAAAYRAAETIKSEYDGIVNDYTRKSGVVHKEIILPDNAPTEYSARATLWNAVEMAERYKTAQLAREIEISLPRELSRKENISLAQRFVQETFVCAGMCADLCVHDKGDGNPHAHIMLTMRPIDKDGKWGQKSHSVNGKKVPTVDWNEHTKAEEWRAAWSDVVNAYFEKIGSDTRIDHRSYERQGVEQIPTVHLGVAASQMERRGIRTDLGNKNREIEVSNQQIRQLRARIKKVKTWVYSQPLVNPPSMVDTMNGVGGGKQLMSQWERIRSLQTRARALMFLQRNGVYDMEQLAGKIEQMHERVYEVSDEIKGVDRRLGTLATHLVQYEVYKKRRGVYKKHKELSGKNGDAFYDKHYDGIQEYEAARDYLKKVLNGRTSVPLAKWQLEQMELTDKRLELCETYYQLKDDVKDVEVLRRSTDKIMREVKQEQQLQRSQDIDL